MQGSDGASLDGEALCLLAGLRCLRGDLPGLAELAAMMNQDSAADKRYHFFAAVCRLAANDFAGALESCARATATPPIAASNPEGPVPANPPIIWQVETAYLSGLARLGLERAREPPNEALAASRREFPPVPRRRLAASLARSDRLHG